MIIATIIIIIAFLYFSHTFAIQSLFGGDYTAELLYYFLVAGCTSIVMVYISILSKKIDTLTKELKKINSKTDT